MTCEAIELAKTKKQASKQALFSESNLASCLLEPYELLTPRSVFGKKRVDICADVLTNRIYFYYKETVNTCQEENHMTWFKILMYFFSLSSFSFLLLLKSSQTPYKVRSIFGNYIQRLCYIEQIWFSFIFPGAELAIILWKEENKFKKLDKIIIQAIYY